MSRVLRVEELPDSIQKIQAHKMQVPFTVKHKNKDSHIPLCTN